MSPADSSSAARDRRQSAQRADEVFSEDGSSLEQLQAQVRNLAQTLRARTSELEAADRHIAKLEEKLFKLKELSREVKQLKEEKQLLRKSPERKLGQILLAPYRLPQKLFRALRRNRARATARSGSATEYQRWFEKHRATPEQLATMREEARSFATKPLISVIVPVFNAPVAWFVQAVDSVVAQAYENWELIVVDDGSTDPELRQYLGTLDGRDPRMNVLPSSTNRGISAALNSGIDRARGDWLAFLDHDDLLEPDALFQTAKLLQHFPDADLIYSDEDKLSDTGFERPLFKPDWSPELLLSGNYVSHFVTVRREMVQSVGGFRSELDSAQDYDLVLRITERTQRIHHVPRVLYHWRRSAASSAIDVRQKPGQLDAARRALEEHLQREAVNARVAIDWPTHTFWVQRELIQPQKISIVIPLIEASQSIERCLQCLGQTTYPDYEIVIVGPEKHLHESRTALSRLSHRLLEFGGALNYPALNNFAVAQTQSPWLLFLLPAVEARDPEWLKTMATHIQRGEVGAVGPLLLGPDHVILHAGVVVGTAGIAQSVLRGFAANDPSVLKRAGVTRNCSAVSGACLLTRRDVFAQVGGFDEGLAHAFHDVDLCLKLRRAGYLVVYTPFARLHQHAGADDEAPGDSRDAERMRKRWAEMPEHDPYYNPNLSRERADFSLGN
ncbi:MAG: glycosyltransferase [Chthoniobacterales bacterium]